MRVLLVEDDPSIASILKTVLEIVGGHEVTWINRGDIAIDQIVDAGSELVLLDSMLPGAPGIEICRHYRSNGGTAPVIFLSARSDEKDIANYTIAGANGFIEKPFDPSLLMQHIDRILSDTKTEVQKCAS